MLARSAFGLTWKQESDMREQHEVRDSDDFVELGDATELTLGIPAQNRKENLVVEDYKN